MGLGVDLGVGCRDRMKVESIFGDVTICELSAVVVLWGSGCCRIEGQSNERGRRDDPKQVTAPAIK